MIDTKRIAIARRMVALGRCLTTYANQVIHVERTIETLAPSVAERVKLEDRLAFLHSRVRKASEALDALMKGGGTWRI